jgi:mitochondrial fission protein ELM1
MTRSPKHIWLLLDTRPGHAAQVRAVANALQARGEIEIEAVPLSYSPLAHLPNALLGARIAHLSAEAKTRIAPPWPDLVIACGRRTLPVLRYLKKHAPEIRTVYLMKPDHMKGVDLAAIPAHDEPPSAHNVLPTTGPLSAISADRLAEAGERWQGEFARLPTPRIGVLLGGKPAKGKYEHKAAMRLVHEADLLAREHGSLLITSSRRTPRMLLNAIPAIVTQPYFLYRWQSLATQNPYAGILALSDALAVAGDSLSMCAEAVSTGKPVFIQTGPGLPRKHRAYHESLFARGVAKPLTPASSLQWLPAPATDDAALVAETINTRFLAGIMS